MNQEYWERKERQSISINYTPYDNKNEHTKINGYIPATNLPMALENIILDVNLLYAEIFWIPVIFC